MTEAKHTPTPWIVGSKAIGFPSTLLMQLKQGGPYKSFAECDCGDDPTDEANASLIVKAVNLHDELIEAIQTHLQWMETGEVDGVFFDEASMKDELRNILNKATGA